MNCMQGTRIIEDYPPLFSKSYEETADTSDEPLPSLDAMFDHCSASNPILPLPDAAYYEGEQLPYDVCGSWADNLFPCSYGADGYGYRRNSTTADEPYQTEEQYASDSNPTEEVRNWSTFDNYLGYSFSPGFADQIYEQDRGHELRPAYSYIMDEMGFCEGIFGHWPCLDRLVKQDRADGWI